jgi:hypothetical protein
MYRIRSEREIRAAIHRDGRGHFPCGPSSVTLCAATLVALWTAPHAIAVPTFTNVTQSAGINHVQSSTPGVEGMTGGAAAADFDGDGLVDLYFTRVDASDVLYRNTGSGFVDVSAQAGFTQSLPTSGASFADIDNDGDLDLYVTATSHPRYYLYINDGAGHFNEEGLARGAAVMGDPGITRRGMGVAFGDYDGDGFLDILTSDHSRPMATSGSRLLRNLGPANPGHFEDVTHAAGLDVYRQALAVQNTAYRFTPQFTDLDLDGHPDIVFSADSRTSQLFWNNGDGTFTDGTIAAGVGTDKSGMGSALADYDGDGDMDWFVSAIFDTPFVGVNPGNRLYRNNGDRTFTDVTTAAGVRNSGSGSELSWGWGTTFLDYDNDTHQDLAITDGWIALGYGGDHTTLRRNNGDGTFTDVSTSSGITDTGQGRALLRVDYDADGDEDILIANYGAAPILYRNDGGNSANWLNVRTEGTISNRDGIGAFIKVIPDIDHPETFQVREIASGDSYLAQSELTAHFGLGDFAGPIDLIEVHWPASGITQPFTNIPINSTLLAKERLPGDFNDDLVVDAADYVVWRSSLDMEGTNLPADGSGPTSLPDGVVDQWDFSFWATNFGAARTSSRPASSLSTLSAAVPEPPCAAFLAILACSVPLRALQNRSLAPGQKIGTAT